MGTSPSKSPGRLYNFEAVAIKRILDGAERRQDPALPLSELVSERRLVEWDVESLRPHVISLYAEAISSAIYTEDAKSSASDYSEALDPPMPEPPADRGRRLENEDTFWWAVQGSNL